MPLVWIRRGAWAVLAVAIVVTGLLFWHRAAAQGDPAGQADPGIALPGTTAPGFVLTDDAGQSTSLAEFRGRVVVLSFIDSRCVTVCPLTALALHQAQTALDSRAGGVPFLAVNANRAHTAVSDVRAWFDEHGMTGRWRFLTGRPAQLEPVWQGYHVEAQIVHGQDMHAAANDVIDRQVDERFEVSTDLTGGFAQEARGLVAAIRPLVA